MPTGLRCPLIAGVLLLATVPPAVDAQDSEEQKDRPARIAAAHRLAAESQNVLQSNVPLSLLLAVEAVRVTADRGEPAVMTAHTALQRALMSSGGRPLGAYASNVQISPDNRWLVTGNRLWNLTADDPAESPFLLDEGPNKFCYVEFSSDNRHLVRISENRVILWDLTGTQPIAAELTGPGPEKWMWAKFSPDGRWLAAPHQHGDEQDHLVRVWDLKSKDPANSSVYLRGHRGVITQARFSPDGRWLATAGNATACLWNLPADGSIQPGHVLKQHTEYILTLVWSADSRWLISSGQKQCFLWNLTTPEPSPFDLKCIAGTESMYHHSVAVTADSRWLAIATKDHRLLLWDLSEKDPAASVRELARYSQSVLSLHVSADNRWLAAGEYRGQSVQLWDLQSPAPDSSRYNLAGSLQEIQNLAVDPRGCWVASAGTAGELNLWDLRGDRPAATSHVLLGHEKPVDSLFVSADGQLLFSAGWDGTIRVWKPGSPHPAMPVAVLRGHEGNPRISALSSDNRWLVSQAKDGGRLWDLTAPDQTLSPLTLPGPRKMTDFQCFFDPHETRLVVCGRYTPVVLLWDLQGSFPAVSELGRLQKQIQSVAISPDRRWLAVGSRIDQNGLLWDLSSSEPAEHPYLLDGHAHGIRDLGFSPDGHWLVSGGYVPGGNLHPTLLLWNLQDDDPTATPLELQQDGHSSISPAFSADGRWLISSSGSTARVWDLHAEDPSRTPLELKEQGHSLWQHAISPDGHWAVTLQLPTRTIRLWDLTDKDPASSARVLGTINTSFAKAVVFTADSRRLVARDGLLASKVWDLHSENIEASLLQLPHFSFESYAGARSPNSRWVVSMSDDYKTRLWDLSDLTPETVPAVLEGHKYGVYRSTFSPDSRWLVTGSDQYGAPRLWDLVQANPSEAVVELPGNTSRVELFVFSDDGRWLATSDRLTTHVWDLQSPQISKSARRFDVPGEYVRTLSFSPDGETLICGYSGGIVRLWTLDLQKLIEQATRQAGRELTEQERAAYDIPARSIQTAP